MERYLRLHTTPGATIVVSAPEPEIPFYAQRHSATEIDFMSPLMPTHRDTHALQERIVREVEAARPAYAVLVKTHELAQQLNSDQSIQTGAPVPER